MVSTLPSQEVSSNKQRERAGGSCLLVPAPCHPPLCLGAASKPAATIPEGKTTTESCVASTLKECEAGQWSGMSYSLQGQ